LRRLGAGLRDFYTDRSRIPMPMPTTFDAMTSADLPGVFRPL